jgi:UDP-N-acetylglucosamine--N-acetylmuramyl-(pentapeptide) pyrophosphoryl-undecaprenol N-acetylglucosamine transferase
MISGTVNVVIAGGGDPNVLLPSLAIADQLKTLLPNSRMIFTGSGCAAEYRRVSQAGHQYCLVGSPAVTERKPRLVDRLTRFAAERHFLRQMRPGAVVSAGGEVGERLGRAAMALGVPLVVLEHDAVPCRATRCLAPLADLVCLGYEETRQYLRASCPIRVTGVPLHGSCLAEYSDAARRPDNAIAQVFNRLVVLADRIGSYQLNWVLPRALSRLRSRLDGWHVVHQTGAEEVRAVKSLYHSLGINAVATSYIHNLQSVLDKSDLAISDASSATVAEVAAAGIPTVLAPSKQSSDARQLNTARMLQQRGACVVVERTDRECDWTRALDRLLADSRRRRRLSSGMRRHFRSDAAWQIAAMIRDILCSAGRRHSA